MRMIDFKREHIEEAREIAIANYEEERRYIPILPKETDIFPSLKSFADNKLGTAAFEEGRMVGFLGVWQPGEDMFGTTGVRGCFSPLHAHGAVGDQRDRIYSMLYQTAAEKWVREGIASHSIALYSHDHAAINSFFQNGFGLRCIDAIRSLEDIPMISSGLQDMPLEYYELPKEDGRQILVLHRAYITHFESSPIFMKYSKPEEEEDIFREAEEGVRYFAVRHYNKLIAYIKIGPEGETFISHSNNMRNVIGAYCLPEYRGSGIYHNLLAYLVTVLKKEGYERLGVDFESFNPNARGFWMKYFTAYTSSVVRHVDENAVNRQH